MTEPEDRLRALRDLDVPEAAPPAALHRRIIRRRRRLAIAGLAAGTLLVAGVAVTATGGGERAVVDTADETTTSSTLESSTTSTTTQPTFVSSSVPFVTASPEGVAVHDGDDITQISTAAARSAFAIDADTVVFQEASTDVDGSPFVPDGPLMIWTDGGVRALPMSSNATRSALLDAALVDGAPVALIGERFGEVGPDDTFEELVLIDLRNDERTTIVRRPAWESSHIAGRLLPDGDVIGLFSSEILILLARWSPGAGDALWTEEVGVDTHLDLTLQDGAPVLVQPSFEGDRDLSPVLVVSRYDLDGTRVDSNRIPIADPGGDLGEALLCRDWLGTSELLCGRNDGSPIAVSVPTGTFTQLPGPSGAFATVARRS